MKLKAILTKYVNSKEPEKERKVGRYWSSELDKIISGELKPDQFFKKEEKDFTASAYILKGYEKEATLQASLSWAHILYDYQPKKEIKITEEIILVVVADFLFSDRVLELKTTNKIDKIKPYHQYQLEAQYRAFNRPVWVLYVREWYDFKFFPFRPSIKRWNLIQDKLKEFHEAVKQYENRTS